MTGVGAGDAVKSGAGPIAVERHHPAPSSGAMAVPPPQALRGTASRVTNWPSRWMVATKAS